MYGTTAHLRLLCDSVRPAILTLSTIYRWKKANKATLAGVAGRDAARMRVHFLPVAQVRGQ
jgi:hypothetical protein